MARKFLKFDTKNRPSNVDANGCLTGGGGGYFLHLKEEDILEEACTSILCNCDDMLKALEKGMIVWLVFPNKHFVQISTWEYQKNNAPIHDIVMAHSYYKGTMTCFLFSNFDYKPSFLN